MNGKNNNDTKIDNDEADHFPETFKEISEAFLDQYKGNKHQTTKQKKQKILNDEMNNEWLEYHSKNAEFRWLPKEDNRPGRPKRKPLSSDTANCESVNEPVTKKKSNQPAIPKMNSLKSDTANCESVAESVEKNIFI